MTDDAEPVTQTWLKEIGVWTEERGRAPKTADGRTVCLTMYGDLVHLNVGDGYYVVGFSVPAKTRGDVRRLYEALGVRIPSPTPPEVRLCGHCRTVPAVAGDEDGRCAFCIKDGWVRTYKAGGWSQLGVYDG